MDFKGHLLEIGDVFTVDQFVCYELTLDVQEPLDSISTITLYSHNLRIGTM